MHPAFFVVARFPAVEASEAIAKYLSALKDNDANGLGRSFHDLLSLIEKTF